MGYLAAKHPGKTKFDGSMDTFLDILNSIRLAAYTTGKNSKNRFKVLYKLEEMEEEQTSLAKTLDITERHINRPKNNGIGVYT